MLFDHEQEVYQAHLMDLMTNEGKFVVVKGDDLIGPFDTYEQATEAGFARFGPVSMLVKRIYREGQEPVHYFSRGLP